MTSWKTLLAGPHLRRIIAERLGWHMRKVWVGSGGIEYDYLVYNNDDHLVYQSEITADDLADEQTAEDQTWLEAMQDEDCPLWDHDFEEALDLAYGLEYNLIETEGIYSAWVKSSQYTGEAETKPLALVRAWLAATEDETHSN
jgi:hypothetical protein